GVDGKPMAGLNGYAAIIIVYDDAGQLTSAEFLDVNGVVLTQYAITIDVGHDDEGLEIDSISALGIEPGDVFIVYADWVWFEHDEDSSYLLLFSFLMEVYTKFSGTNQVVLYRPSTQECSVYEFTPEIDFWIEEYWFSDAEYAKMMAAYQSLR
ncbi:MAG: hypothetical protein FWE65_03380, partial [Eggerthellaceae bacterium]|nr:hypothetical protein [Eggerthellaceae bacterium]